MLPSLPLLILSFFLHFVVSTGEQQGQTERDEVIAVTGRFEGLSAQGLREGAQTLDR